VAPATPAWDAAVTALAAARLNAADPAGLRERWAAGCAVHRLVPVAYVTAGAGDDTTGAGSVQPPRIAATTFGAQPWHLGGRRRRLRKPRTPRPS
jgi:hypothetical protein